MNSTLDYTLRSVTEETFASLAFLMPLSDEECEMLGEESSCADGREYSRVDFCGPFAGSLMIAVDRKMLLPLATNMLGLLGCRDASLDQQHDALKELTNVVCGNLLPQIATAKDVFKVFSPELLDQKQAEELAAGRLPESQVSLSLDGGSAQVTLFVDHALTAAIA